MKSIEMNAVEFAPGPDFRLGPLTLDLEPRSRTALVGKSGAGKSTLLRLLAGLERPSGGEIRLNGAIASGGTVELPPHARGIGFVFQGGGLWPHMDALAHLTFAAPALSRDAARALLARVGLAGKEARRPSELSGGEAQRLALARAIATRPRILLLDEPLRSLDVHLRVELSLLVRELADETGATLLAVTHEREEAMLLGESAIVLEAGKIVERGRIEDLVRAPATAHTAALLAEAALVPARRAAAAGVASNGTVLLATPFGEHEWHGALPDAGGVVLALLEGDVELAKDEAGPLVEGTVLYAEREGGAHRLHVHALGTRLKVASPRDAAVGATVRLALVGTPRLLPWSGAEGVR
jgi:iron(III) transport system ATP-binding protein